MVYSELLDWALCMACALFCKNHRNNGHFVNRPFTAWYKRTEKCKQHELTQYHQESLQQAEICTQAVEHPTSTVSTLLDTKNISIKNFYQAYWYLVKTLEMIGYRGHIEKDGDLYSDWDTANRSEAQQILTSIASFDFIVVFISTFLTCLEPHYSDAEYYTRHHCGPFYGRQIINNECVIHYFIFNLYRSGPKPFGMFLSL